LDRQELIKIAEDFIGHSEDNIISREIAISDNVVGMKIFDTPILAFGAADDEYFKRLKDPTVIGEHFMLPAEWLPKAKTVISFFLPFSEAVRIGNRRDMSWPTEEWLHARIEGQALLFKLCRHLESELQGAGYESLVPSLDKRFWVNHDNPRHEAKFTSNWSERHVAFTCGLGTFGLSKGLITKKGMAGRFGSVITDLYITPDKREYEDIYEYCTMCGKCADNCPVMAITTENGKNHVPCFKFLCETEAKHKPRYGCGKCQVAVPCESRIPIKRSVMKSHPKE